MKRVIVVFILSVIFCVNINAKEDSIKESSFKEVQEQIQNKQALMMEFGTNSCFSCKVMGKILYKIKKEHPKTNIFYLNVYENRDILKDYGVRMIPTQVFLNKDGKIIGKHIGMLKEEQILTKLKEYEILK